MSTQTMRARGPAARPVWEEEPTPVGKALKGLAIAGILLAILFPVYVVVLTSLSSQETISAAGGLVIVPGEITFQAYQTLLSGGVVTRALLVSTGVTIVGTLLSLSVTVLAAYGLSRPGSLWHKPLLFVFLLTFLFGPGLIPTYLLVSSLGLIDNYLSLILPSAVSAFFLIVMRAFFMNIPAELIDSARIDGASEFRILARIVLPMSKAVVAVIGLFYGVMYWNAFFNAILYLRDNTMWPLQMILRQYVLQGQQIARTDIAIDTMVTMPPNLALRMAVVVLALVPVVIVYPFIQRHFVKGVIIGAVKG